MLLNDVEDGFATPPGQERPPLIIDFALPQRAVALEFGFVTQTAPGEDPPFIGDDVVELVARNKHGDLIPRAFSTAEAIFGQGQILANTPTFVIGVRHAEGEIASVELHFTNPNDADKVQIVARIWHEALPPAAVLQGTLVTEGGRGSFVPFTGALGQLPEPVDRYQNPIPFRTERLRTVPLPFRFNRGIVMLRGFKLQTLDQTPREVQRIAVEVNPRLPAGPVRQTPGVFEVERGGSVILEPKGALITRERRPPGHRVHIYFTLVGWDSDQVDVAIEQGEQTLSLEQDSFVVGSPLRITDPCSTSGGGSEGCGPLFGALQGLEFRMPEDQEVDELRLAVGESGAELNGDPQDGEIPDLRRVRSRLEWRFGSYLSGGDTYFRSVRGAVMTGRSVRIESGDRGLAVDLESVGARPSPDTFLDFPPTRRATIDGDLGFVGLDGFIFEPDGPIREMEIEVLGTSYDGQVLQWDAGAGLSTSPAITGSTFGVDNTDGFAFPLPSFGSLSRRSLVPRTGLRVQHLEFFGWTGLLTYSPSAFGAIRNDGNIPAVITNIQRSGPQSLNFMIILHHRGAELSTWSPIVILPGETLLVGGRFYPQTPLGANDPLHTAFLDFETNVAAQPTLRMNVTGRTAPQDAMAEIFPLNLNFGHVRFSASGPPSRNMFLISVGSSPLLVQSVHFENHNIHGGAFPSHAGTFHWRFITDVSYLSGLYQVDPGAAAQIQITFTPVALGTFETRLIFETNAGVLELPLKAEVVSQNPGRL